MHPDIRLGSTMWAALRAIDQLQGRLDAVPIGSDWLDAARDRALAREALHTTRIEGSQITIEEASLALSGADVPTARPDDVRELLNYRTAYERVIAYVASGRPITQVFIREVHRALVAGVRGGAAAPGEYRRVQNYVVNQRTGATIYTPPPANEIPDRMAALTEWLAEAETHPVLAAGIAQFELVDMHPFLDGNGRTARLLSLACLHRSGYAFRGLFSLSEFYDDDRGQYYDAIQGVRDSGGDPNGWLAYFANGLRTQLERAVDHMERRVTVEHVAGRSLNPHQQRILEEVLRNGSVSIRTLAANLPSVPRRTLQYALHQFVDSDVLVAEGETQTRRYVAGPALHRALAPSRHSGSGNGDERA